MIRPGEIAIVGAAESTEIGTVPRMSLNFIGGSASVAESALMTNERPTESGSARRACASDAVIPVQRYVFL